MAVAYSNWSISFIVATLSQKPERIWPSRIIHFLNNGVQGGGANSGSLESLIK